MAPSPSAALATAMSALYAVAPEEFMAERTRVVAEAKAAGEADAAATLGKLRKPSIAAWALNLLAREAPDLVDGLDDLGGRMRDAQGRLDTRTLSSLRPERDALLEDLVRTAARLVADHGRTLSTAAQQDVRGTAIAALADEQAMAAVASGQLTRALSYSGFGEVDLAEAVVRTTSGAILTVVPGGGGSGRGSRDGSNRGPGPRAGEGEPPDATAEPGQESPPDEDTLAAALAAAQRGLADAEQAVTRARERAEETRERLAVVERQLTKAREADERALEAVTDAVRARKDAEAARHTAEQALAAARGHA